MSTTRPTPIPDDPPLFLAVPFDFTEMTAAELGDHVSAADGFDALLAGVQAAAPAEGIDWTEHDADLADAEVWAAAVAEDVDPGFPDELEAAENEAERRADLAALDVYNNFVAPPAVAPPPEDPLEGLPEQVIALQQQLGGIVALTQPPLTPAYTLPPGAVPLTPAASASGLMSLSDVGVLTWTSGGGLSSPIEIWVSADGDEPALVAQAASGAAQHAWLFNPGHTFRFSLRAAGVEVDSLEVQSPYAPIIEIIPSVIPPSTPGGSTLPPAAPPDVAAINAQITALLQSCPPAPNAQLTAAQQAAGYIAVVTDKTYGRNFVNVAMTAALYARWVALRQQLYVAESAAGLPPQGEPPVTGQYGLGGEEPPPSEGGGVTEPGAAAEGTWNPITQQWE